MAQVVTETGVLESSVDDVVRCRVESFLRLPVGAPRGGAEPRSPQRRHRAGGTAGASASRSRETSIDAVTKAVASAKSKLGGAAAPPARALLRGARVAPSAADLRPSFHPRMYQPTALPQPG